MLITEDNGFLIKEWKMKVLIACEFSGIVRDAFIKRGHEAVSCDLLPTERPGPHIQGDVMKVLYDEKGEQGFDQSSQTPLLNEPLWDLIIAHPPCTYLSNAGARFLYPQKVLNTERFALGLQVREFFMFLHNAPAHKIAIENPVPSKVFCLPEKTQVIQPYYFGHPFQKKTYLWLKNLPKLIPTNLLDKPQSTKVAGNWFDKGGKDRQKNRAKTFQGIADAMAEQWG